MNTAIDTVILFSGGAVRVFDAVGNPIPSYDGPFERVKGAIVTDAPPGATFYARSSWSTVIGVVPRDVWRDG